MSINLDKQRENLPLSVLLSSSHTVTSMNTANFQWKKTCDDQCSKPTTKNFFKKGFPDIWIVPIKSGKTKSRKIRLHNIYCISNSKKSRSWLYITLCARHTDKNLHIYFAGRKAKMFRVAWKVTEATVCFCFLKHLFVKISQNNTGKHLVRVCI